MPGSPRKRRPLQDLHHSLHDFLRRCKMNPCVGQPEAALLQMGEGALVLATMKQVDPTRRFHFQTLQRNLVLIAPCKTQVPHVQHSSCCLACTTGFPSENLKSQKKGRAKKKRSLPKRQLSSEPSTSSPYSAALWLNFQFGRRIPCADAKLRKR